MSTARNALRLFTNAVIATMDPARPEVRAMLVRDGRVAALGDPAELEKDALGAEVIDLGGRFVCPGFVDAHNHFSFTALEVLSVDCRAPAVGSVEELQERIRDWDAREAPGRWLRGYGYDEAALGRHPTRTDLDAAAPDRPVVLVHWSVHRAVANSRALGETGIDGAEPEPAGGWTVRDSAGALTGLLYERATDPVQAASLAAYSRDHAEALPGLFIANAARMWSEGITAIGDAYVHPGLLRAYRGFWSGLTSGSMPARFPPLSVRAFCGPPEGLFAPPWPCLQSPEDMQEGGLLGGGVKIFADGGGNTTSASLASGRAPRFLFYPQEELDALVERAHAAGLPVAIHAAGDIAVTMALDAIERARLAHPALAPRFRIEHAITVKGTDIPRFRSLDVALVTQPEAVFHSGPRLARVGLASGVLVAPFRTLLDAGVTLAFSSDSPCYALPPLWQIWCAVTRRTAEDAVLGDEQDVTVEQALAAYTRAGAAANFDPDGGTLTPGRRADFVVLSADPRLESWPQWSQVSVEECHLRGNRMPVDADEVMPPPGRPVPLP